MNIEKNDIFKFSPVNVFLFKNLTLSQIWFSPPDSMNDQLEGLIKIKNIDFKPSKKALENFIKSNFNENDYLYANEQIKNNGFVKLYMENWFRILRNQFGISCFSQNPKEPLMWSHYADKHNGLCLIYDKEVILASLRNLVLSFECSPINYKTRPILELYEKNNKIIYKSNEPLITSKNSNWRYEKEIRFYAKLGTNRYFKGYSLPIYHTALKGVIYGAHMSEEDIDSISLILRNDPQYTNVKEYNANLDYEKGKIFFAID